VDVAGRGHEEQIRRIQSVADAALAHLEVDDLLEELLIRIRDALGSDTAAFLLLDEGTDELVARAAEQAASRIVHEAQPAVALGDQNRVGGEVYQRLGFDHGSHGRMMDACVRRLLIFVKNGRRASVG